MKLPKIIWFIAIPAAVVILLLVSLPSLLRLAGINPRYDGPTHAAPGRRALIVTTSQAVLGDTGKATGVYASELTVPYYTFLDGGMSVDVASIAGGAIPVEPMSLRWPLLAPEDRRYLADPEFRKKTEQSLSIDEVDFASYDAIFLAGGWGASYDLAQSEVLGTRISQANAAGAVLGSVCHGALGFLQARTPQGEPLVRGRRITAVTDKQVSELRITVTPLHPERELRAAGALYEGATAFRDMLASHVVVDGNLITGQNQNDGAETAQKMLEFIERKGL